MFNKNRYPFRVRQCTGLALLSLVVSLALAGCRHQKPNVIYMPDMVYSPAIKAQSEGSMRLPVAGTISRDFEPYPFAKDAEAAGRELKNPIKPTREVMKRGQHVYNTFCIVCHGAKGLGDGTIVPKFPRPPSLHSDKVRNWSDGSIYHVITMGQNLMPSYASQISPGDRWAAIHYIRALQRSENPSAEDIKISEKESQ